MLQKCTLIVLKFSYETVQSEFGLISYLLELWTISHCKTVTDGQEQDDDHWEMFDKDDIFWTVDTNNNSPRKERKYFHFNFLDPHPSPTKINHLFHQAHLCLHHSSYILHTGSFRKNDFFDFVVSRDRKYLVSQVFFYFFTDTMTFWYFVDKRYEVVPYFWF